LGHLAHYAVGQNAHQCFGECQAQLSANISNTHFTRKPYRIGQIFQKLIRNLSVLSHYG
jgi:hypothetical protein